jgi:hypothetical protein
LAGLAVGVFSAAIASCGGDSEGSIDASLQSPFGLSGVCTIFSANGAVVIPGEFDLRPGESLSELRVLEADGGEPTWYSVHLLRSGSVGAGTVDDIALIEGEELVDPSTEAVEGPSRWLLAFTTPGPIDSENFSRLDRIVYKLNDAVVDLEVNFQWRVWSGNEDELPPDC